MAESKTRATAANPDAYVAAIADPARRSDCEALLALMATASKQPAVMWGPAIVGFGVHRYELSGGKQGDICAVGFSSRASDISLYGMTGHAGAPALIARLGKHRLGKGCLYVKRLTDIHVAVLAALVAQSFAARHTA